MLEDIAQALHIKTLGGLSITHNGRPLTSLASRKTGALLVYLACTGREHPRDVLADMLWDGRTQQQAMANLRVVLSSLRKEVGTFLTISRTTAAIKPTATITVDAHQLEQVATAVQNQKTIQSPEQAQQLQQVLARYEGDFLAGFFLPETVGFESWTTTQRERFHRLFVDASLQLGQWFLDHEEFHSAISTATHLLKIDSLAEAGYRQLMESLALNNQRAEALAQYEKCRQILYEELGLEPELATAKLAEEIKRNRQPPPIASVKTTPWVLTDETKPPKPPTPHNLPFSLTQIIGRDGEIAELTHLLLRSSQRLITLIGVGGIGKTRLATAVAHTVLAGLENPFQDGIFFVSLAALTNVENIVPTIAQAIDFQFAAESRSPRQQLLDFLRHKNMLLIMDNFEQIQEGFSVLLDILHASDGIKIFVTSRESLSIQGEQNYPLMGLSYPRQVADSAKLTNYGAPSLFIERATNLLPDFFVNETNMEDLLQICQLVDGMPLALILAAGWIEVLGLADIVVEVKHSLDSLEATMRDVPARHQSMKAVFDSTWRFLSRREQQISKALSIFRGGFKLEAAREVTDATRRDLKRLIGRSLLFPGEDGRFEQHELLRQFAEQELIKAPVEEHKIRHNHSRYYCTLLKQREIIINGAHSDEVELEITTDLENILAAWYWAADNAPELVFLAQTTLGYFKLRDSSKQIGSELFLYAEARLSNIETGEPRHMAELLGWAALFSTSAITNITDKLIDRANDYLIEAETKEEDYRAEKAFVLSVMGARWDQDLDVRLKYLEESNSIYKELGRQWDVAMNYSRMAYYYHTNIHYSLADEYHQRALELFERVEDRRIGLGVRIVLASNQPWVGKLQEAEKLLHEAMTISIEMGDLPNLYLSFHAMGEALLYSGRFDEAIFNLDQARTIDENRDIEWYMCFRGWALLHLGHYNEMLKQIRPILRGDIEIRKITSYFLGIALFLKGNRELAMNQFEVARDDFKESEELLQSNMDEACWPRVGLIYVALVADNLNEAKKLVIQILELSLFLPLIQVMPVAALLMARLGKLELAVELYAHALTHQFVVNSQWFYDVTLQKLEALIETLPEETVASAQKRGRSLDLWQTAESLLQELSPNH